MSALDAGPGDLLAAGEEFKEADEDGEIHGDKVFGDGEEFGGAVEVWQEDTGESEAVEDGLGQQGTAVEGLAGQDDIAGEHGHEEERDQPAEQFVAEEGEADAAAEGIEDARDQQQGLEVAGADADTAAEFAGPAGERFVGNGVFDKDAAVASGHDFHPEDLVFGDGISGDGFVKFAADGEDAAVDGGNGAEFAFLAFEEVFVAPVHAFGPAGMGFIGSGDQVEFADGAADRWITKAADQFEDSVGTKNGIGVGKDDDFAVGHIDHPVEHLDLAATDRDMDGLEAGIVDFLEDGPGLVIGTVGTKNKAEFVVRIINVAAVGDFFRQDLFFVPGADDHGDPGQALFGPGSHIITVMMTQSIQRGQEQGIKKIGIDCR